MAFWCWFQGGWVCVHSSSLWVSSRNSPVRLGVSLAAATPTSFYSQKFWGFISLGCMVCITPQLLILVYLHSNVGLPQSASCCLASPSPPCTTSPAQCSSCCFAVHPLRPGCPSLPLLPVWMNVSSFTPWLLDFHTVQFSGSSGYFLFLNLCCPSFDCMRWQSVSTYAAILAVSRKSCYLIWHTWA